MTYGVGTHSFLNSTEHRQMKRDRRTLTEKYEAGEVAFGWTQPPLLCPCGITDRPHELSLHKEKLSGDGDWRCFWSREMKPNWRRP